MSEENNWVANGDYSIHPIQRCNNCDAIFQGLHRCEYEDLMVKNKKLRMEIYEMKMKEKIEELKSSLSL